MVAAAAGVVAGDGGCGCVCGMARFAEFSLGLQAAAAGGGCVRGCRMVSALRFACQRADALNPSSNYEKAYTALAWLSLRRAYALSSVLCNTII